MSLQFFYPQGGDPAFYLEKASICAAGGDCWTPRHCAGFISYASIPYRMGWRPEALVGMNLALMALSILLSVPTLKILLPTLREHN
jgi:hypothetical protein